MQTKMFSTIAKGFRFLAITIVALTASVTHASTYSDNVISLNPSVYYRLNETEVGTVYDSSGNGYDGQHPGTFAVADLDFTPGALAPADTDSALRATTRGAVWMHSVASDVFSGGADPFSFSMWLKPESFEVGDYSTPFAYGCYPLERYNGLMVAENGVDGDGRLRIGRTYQDFIVSQAAMNLNEWNHVGMTYDGTTAKLFLNGQLDTSVDVALSVGAGGTTINNGGIGDLLGGKQRYDGGIDELAYFKTTLTDQQMVDLGTAPVVPLPANNTFTNGDFSDGLNGWQTWDDAGTTAPEITVTDGVATISRENGADAWSTGVIYQVVNVAEGETVRIGGDWAGDMSSLGAGEMWWGEVALFSMPDITEEKIGEVFDYPGYLQDHIAEGETNRGGSYASGSDIINSFGSALPTWAMQDIDGSQYDWEAAKAAFEAAGHTWDPTQRLEYNFTEVESCGQVVVALKFGGQTGGEVSFDDITLEIVPDHIAGDANGDGKVDGSDVTILAGNWQKGVSDGLTAEWEEGDFNGDGKVDGSDVTILAGNWQYGVEAAAAAVPEPSTIALLLMAFGSLLVWKRMK